jgi:tetratricopeptide (TPR) repeat protein
MKDMEYSKKKGLVKQYTNQAEKILNENQHIKNQKEKKYFLGEALTKINLAIEMGKNMMVSARAFCMRAKIYRAQGDLNNAIKDMDKAIELNSQYIEIYRTRAEFYSEMKRFNEAIKDYTTVFELSKGKDWISLFEIGNIYFESEEYNNAIEYYTKLIESFDAPPWVYGKRALAYTRVGKLQEAERDKETANLPEWFFNISPIFYEDVVNTLRGKEPETLRYIPAGKGFRFSHNPNGTIVFGPKCMERAFDAKTGKFLWHS